MKMTKTTGWSLGTTGLCVAIVAGSWFGLVDPQRAAAAESRELTVAAQATNSALEIEIEQLRQQFADLPAKQAELAAMRQALPEDPALAQLIRDLSTKSTDAGTTLDSVTSGAPVAVIDAAAVVAAPVTEEGAAPADPAAAPSTPAADPAAPADPAAGAEPVDPAAAPVVAEPVAQPVLAAIPVTVTLTGNFSGSTLFLKNVQAEMPRALLVDSLVLSLLEGEDTEAGTVQTVLTGRVFVFVDPTEIPDVPVLPATPSDG